MRFHYVISIYPDGDDGSGGYTLSMSFLTPEAAWTFAESVVDSKWQASKTRASERPNFDEAWWDEHIRKDGFIVEVRRTDDD